MTHPCKMPCSAADTSNWHRGSAPRRYHPNTNAMLFMIMLSEDYLSEDRFSLCIHGAGSGNRNRNKPCARCKKPDFIVLNYTKKHPYIPYVSHTFGTLEPNFVKLA